MGEFFKGWRRKAGLVTLAMAMLSFGAWMRSHIVEDVLIIPHREAHIEISSVQGQLSCVMLPDGYLEDELPWNTSDISQFADVDVDLLDLMHGLDRAMSEFRCLGFRVGKGKMLRLLGSDDRFEWFEFVVIPYWSFVLPLTLLSGWLILAKPRKAKATTGSTP